MVILHGSNDSFICYCFPLCKYTALHAARNSLDRVMRQDVCKKNFARVLFFEIGLRLEIAV